MFQNLKHRNARNSEFKDMPNPIGAYSKSPSVTTSGIKGNEAERLVRCKICGFICDKERDVQAKNGSYAGLGVAYSTQQTASACISDKRVPAAGTISTSADTYYTRTISGGCPFCGCLIYE
jgi:hypothetical protein